jgi:synaptobrevin family protein YKT6
MASGGASSAPKYKVLSINVMRWNSDSEEPILLDAAYNLADYSFFTRGSVKEFLAFAARTVMKRVTAGSHALDYEGNIMYCVIQPDGLGVIVITDKVYPPRVALKLGRETLEEFKGVHGCVRANLFI